MLNVEGIKKKMLAADLALLVVAVIWGTGFIVTKNILSGITPLYMVAMRFLVATVIIAVITGKKLLRIKLQDVKGGVIVGLMLFMGFATQTIGIQYTTAGKSAFLTGTNVVMVPFIVWFIYKKRPDVYAIAAAALCFIGVSLLTTGTELSALSAGDLWALSCAAFFAMHIVTTGIFVKKSEPAILTFLQFSFVTVLAFIVAYVFEGPVYMPNQSSMMGVLYLGIFSTCVAFFIQTLAQKYTTETHAAIILSMEAMFGTVFGILLLSEPFTLIMGIGCAVILLAIITAETRWAFLKKKKAESVEQTATETGDVIG